MSELPPPAPEPVNGQSPADTQASTEAPTPSPQTTAGGTDRAGSFGAVFLTTFTTVFLAELGDKTQLAALLLSAESGRPVIVFIGASLALISSSLVGVVLGRWLSRVLPPQQLERLAGILMIGLGLWLGRQAAMTMLPLA
jgi:putative Ca2+/H+ antiporter (TMEM165/GDT1 family)